MPPRHRVSAVVLVLLCGLRVGDAVGLEARPQDPPQEPPPIFRTGVDVVRVDVIVTDRDGKPVTTLTQDDFEVFEDGKPQAIEQFRLVGGPAASADELPARELRTRDDELIDAAREDVRVFAILLDDYHVPQLRSQAVRDALIRFVRTELHPNDLVVVMHPLEPVRTLTFTRDHDAVVQEIRLFEGRKGEYAPRNPVEEQHFRNLPAIERIRSEVVLDALSALSVRLGSLREGRKSVIFVSDGFGTGGAGYIRLRDVARDANRHNVSIYPFNPCGLVLMGEGPRGCGAARRASDVLLYLAEETDGRAIVNRNAPAEGLAQVARDSSAYYLLGYTSTQQASDGKFHPIRVRVKTRGVDVRARKGYWALTAEDVARAAVPRAAGLTPVQQALASIDIAADARRYVRTWVGSERGENGGTRITVSWELLPARDRQQWEQPGRLSVMAGAEDSPLHFRGGGPIQAAPQSVTFDAPPGKLDVRLAVEAAATGETIDREVITVAVPDLAAPAAALSTPRVFVARTANEFRTMTGEAALVPIARREFLRSERLMIRFDAYGGDGERAEVTAALLSWSGDRMADVPIAPAPAGGTHQIAFALGSLAPGEYVVEITVRRGDAEAKELVPLRVTA